MTAQAQRSLKTKRTEKRMMRLLRIALLAGGIIAVNAPAALASTVDDCNQSADLERRIRGCSTLIKQGNLTSQGLAKAYNNRGNAYETKREYDRAIADFNEAIRLVRDNAHLHNRGNAYHGKGEQDRAIADYSEAIRLNPMEARHYNGRGNAYRAKRDYERAIADYNKAIRLNPKYVAAYNYRGLAYWEKREYDLAIVDYNEAIRLDPGNARLYNNRGNAYHNKSEYDRAIADYTQAIRLDPKFATAYRNRGLVYRIKHALDRAIAEYDEAIRIDPKYALAYGNRGTAYHEKGDNDRALADYSEAIRLEPSNAGRYVTRAFFFAANGDFDRAGADLAEAIRLDPKEPSVYQVRGLIEFLRAGFEKAAADFRQALDLKPRPTTAPYILLFRFLTMARSEGKTARDELDAHTQRLESSHLKNMHWPHPVISFYLGRRMPHELVSAARTSNERCEAYFYIGQWHILREDRTSAIDMLQAAASGCPRSFYEFVLARAELERMGITPAAPVVLPPDPVEPVAAPPAPPPPYTPSAHPHIELQGEDKVHETLKAGKGMIILQITSFDPGCRPCVDANRAFESLASKYAARARFVRIHYEPWNAISASSLAGEFKLRSVPTILLFKDGREQRRILGHQPEPVLEKSLFGEGEPKPQERKDKAEAPAVVPPASERPKPRQAVTAYLGCFRDQGNPWGKEGRDLNGARWDDSAMTSARCINFCRSQNFTYAATQYAVACFCGNSYGRSGRADNCNMLCAGNDKEICGGSWANSVWRVGAGSAEAPAVAPVLLDDGNFASASDASLKPYNGVWATSRALCRKYARHISDVKYLGDVTNFVPPQDEGAYLISSRSIRFFDEASNECRLVKIDGLPKAMSATVTCSNAVNPDISTVVLNIAKSNQNYIFKWKRQYRGVREEKVYQCISMHELSETMARLWTFDSKKCAATTAHPEADIIFSKDLEENLIITVTGKIGSAFKNDFAARIFIDQLPPIELSAKAISAGFSLPLGPFALKSSMISDGFLMSVWTEEMASRGSGVYKVPVLELPLLGSGRAMTFLRQCQHKSALAPAPSDQQRVQQFIRDFIARLDRELPDFKHKEPRHKVVDLNGDGRSDIIVVADSPGYCGSAGCDMFVYVAGADGQFRQVYDKKSGDESLPVVGPERKDGYLTLSFPYAAIGNRVVHEVAVWEKDEYRMSHYRDGDIRIDPVPAERRDGIKTDGVLRDRPSLSAAPVESPDTSGLDAELGTVVTGQGSWIVARHCKGCRFGYARIQE